VAENLRQVSVEPDDHPSLRQDVDQFPAST
jgi:hypothetical protein